MTTSPSIAKNPDVAIGAGVVVASALGAVATHHWTLLVVPFLWAFIAFLSHVSMPQRFAALAASTVLLPRYPLKFGLSVDDLLPSAAAITGVILLARWGWPRLPRIIESGFALWLAGGIVSAVANGHGVAGTLKLAAPSIGRPVFWLVFAMTAAAIVMRHGIRGLVIPIAIVASLEALLAVGAYARCTEIHIGVVSTPDNKAIWETHRPLGVEQGAGTNVGEERIRCRATGTLAQSSNFLAAFLVTTLPVTVAAALATRRKARLAFGAGAMLVVTGIILTFTRASVPAAAIAVVVTLLFAAPKRALPVLLAGAVVLGGLAFAVPQIRNRIANESNDRKALWYSGWLIFKDHPVTGVGYGNYLSVQRANPKYSHTKYGDPTSTAHNGFIAIAAEGGIIQLGAVLLLAGGLLVLGYRASKRARGTPEAALVAGAFGACCGFLVQNMTNTLLLVPAVATYFWILAGALAGAASSETPPGIAHELHGVAAE